VPRITLGITRGARAALKVAAQRQRTPLARYVREAAIRQAGYDEGYADGLGDRGRLTDLAARVEAIETALAELRPATRGD